MSDDGWRPTHVRVLYRYKDMTREEWVSIGVLAKMLDAHPRLDNCPNNAAVADHDERVRDIEKHLDDFVGYAPLPRSTSAKP